MRFIMVFLVIFMTVAINLPDNMIRGIGIDPKYLMAALGAWVVAGLLANTKMLLLVLVVGIALLVNLPEASLGNMGIDRTYLIVALICVVAIPFLQKR